MADHNENPAKYLLALKYIEALQQIVQQPSTKVRRCRRRAPSASLAGPLTAYPGPLQVEVVPHEMAFLQTSHALGLNTVMPRRV